MKWLRNNPWFFVPYFILLLAVTPFLMVLDKGDATLWFNSHNTPFLDIIFRFTTKMGEGTFYFVALALLLFVRPAYSVYGLICLIVTSLIIVFLKLVVFSGVVRPSIYFEGKAVIHMVDGVQLYRLHSFPSGHTATAFTLFCFIAMIVRDKRWGAVLLLMGVFAAISRMYLAQHFLVDTYFGSMIGCGVAVVTFNLVKERHWYSTHPRFNQPLVKMPTFKKGKK